VEDEREVELAELLAEVHRIDVMSHRLVTSMMAGGYTAAFRGSGLEFDGVREYEARPMSPSELAGMGQGETRRLGKIDSTENNVDGLALHVAHFKPPSRSARSRQYRRTLRTRRIDTDLSESAVRVPARTHLTSALSQ